MSSQTDVIVNTVSADRNLNSGQISRAVFEEAGHEMQKEIYAYPNRSVYITKPYKLHCKEVYHTCCTDQAAHAADKVQ